MVDLLLPDWPAPANVRAVQTTRLGGVSGAPWAQLNLGDHVGDLPERVAANRGALRQYLPADPCWLTQVHGIAVVDADLPHDLPAADASVARLPGSVCTVMTADCLPVLLCDRAGTVVAAVHAGWRGLLAGVVENALQQMRVPSGEILAWLGPAIGPACFEVGDEVRAAFVASDAEVEHAFKAGVPGKWLADIYALARLRLQAAGVVSISGGDLCTVSDPARFFSYRRDGVTGRMASLIWLESGGSGV